MTSSRLKKSERCAIELLNRQKKLSFYDMAHLDVRRIDTGEDIMFDTFSGYCASVGLRGDAFLSGGHLPDGMTVDKFCTLLAKYWGFSGYRLAQTDDAMFHYAQLNPGGGELLTDFAGANSYLTVYFDGDQSGTPMYISLDRFPGRVNVLFGMLHQVG